MTAYRSTRRMSTPTGPHRALRHAILWATAMAVGCASTLAYGSRPKPSPGIGTAAVVTARLGAAPRDAITRAAPTPNPLRAGGVMAGGTDASGLIRETARGTQAVAPYPDAGEIQLGNGYRFDPLRDGEPAPPSNLTAAAIPGGGRGAYLVQLAGPVDAGQREQIEAAGGIVVAYLPRYTFLVRMTDGARATVEVLSFVRWVGPYQPAYKLSDEPQMDLAGGPATLVVLLFPDADLAAERAALEAMGGTVIEATDSGRNKLVRVSIDGAQASTIAARNDVAWVEPWHQPVIENATAQWVVQTNVTNNRHIWDMGIQGQGQVVHTSDSGIRTTHNAFRDPSVSITTFGDYPTHRKIIAYRAALPGILFGDASGASYHGTHTAGTIVGDDSPFATNLNDGQALKAKIFFTDAGNTANSISTPGDLNLLFGPAYQGNAGGAARISSNSWGASSNNYDVLAMSVDQFMWDHKDFLICFSNGNDFAAAMVGTPAVNKDGIGVGATQNGTTAGVKASFSSEGPTEDGRRKPTICAPGDGVTPLSGITSANGANDTGYQNLAGTSMSSPAAAGAAALIRQYLTDGWYPTGAPVSANGFNPSAALLKAMEITSTDNDMPGHPIPDYGVGWGRIKLDNVMYFTGEATRLAVVDDNGGLTTGQFAEYGLDVYDTSVPLKVTLCWTDKEGNPASMTQLVNDLDLTVTDPNGVPYLGNVMSGGQSAPGGAADFLNVEEGFRSNAPLSGVWKIRVSAANVPFGPQPFALAITGGVGNVGGLLSLDRHVYGRDDLIQVRVDDANAAGPVSVTVGSSTESTPETVLLSGSGGVFTGSIATTPLEAAHGDGKLSVSHGDAVTVTYVDAAPAATLTASATIDFDGPEITGVGAAERGENQLVTWSTNVQASTRVYYGTTTALGQATPLDQDLVLTHGVLLTGLQPQTEYFYDVESAGQDGNVTRDDNGGSHYRFVSGSKGDILVVIGDGSFPGTSTYVDALIERGWNPSVLEGGTIDNPPLGDRNSGLRSFTTVWWQCGQEQYPPVPDAAREVLTQYQQGGGRLAVTGHDISWAFTDPASGFYTPDRVAWLEGTLHARFLEDPAAWVVNQGVTGDPISDPYAAGVPYSAHRQGASGDEIELVAGSGTGSYVWKDTDATQGNIGLRWQSATPDGSPAGAVWGGTPSKLLYNAFEWLQLVNAADRTDILDRSLIWLIGNDHPDVAVQSPNGGEVVNGNTVSVTWTETPHGGATIAQRAVYYSPDGGQSWRLVTTNAGASPYAWNVSGLLNGTAYRVRVDVSDNGNPALHGHDGSDADFTIARPGGDNRGPVVVAGSLRSDPNPMDNRAATDLLARISDVAAGGSRIAAAEWSRGDTPAPAGMGVAMSGPFDGPDNEVSAAIPAGKLPRGESRFWVRGRDAAGNWGPASSRTILVNGDAIVSADDNLPARFALHQNVPNPVSGPSTVLRYGLPRSGPVELAIYGLRGERVRTLVSEFQAAGRRSVVWNRRDDSGRLVPSGIYFYRLEAGGDRATRKVVVLE